MWNRIPLALRALLLAISVTGTATLVWGVLAQTNLRLSAELPWAAVVMAVFLIGLAKVHGQCTASRTASRSAIVDCVAMVIGGRRTGARVVNCVVHIVTPIDPMAAACPARPFSHPFQYTVADASDERHGGGYQRGSRLPRIFAGTVGAPIRSRRSHRRHQHCFRARPFEPWRISARDSLRYWLGCTLRIADLSEWFHFAGGGAAQQCRHG